MSKKPLLLCSLAVTALLLMQSGLGHASILTKETGTQPEASMAAKAASLLDQADWQIFLPGITYAGGDARLTLVGSAGQILAAADSGAFSLNGVALTPAEKLQSGAGVSYDIRSFLTKGLNTLNLTVDAGLFKDLHALSFVISTASAPTTPNSGSGANTGNTNPGSNTGNTTGNTTVKPGNTTNPTTPGNNATPNDQPIPNPEPATMILLGSGLTGLLAAARKARKT